MNVRQRLRERLILFFAAVAVLTIAVASDAPTFVTILATIVVVATAVTTVTRTKKVWDALAAALVTATAVTLITTLPMSFDTKALYILLTVAVIATIYVDIGKAIMRSIAGMFKDLNDARIRSGPLFGLDTKVTSDAFKEAGPSGHFSPAFFPTAA